MTITVEPARPEHGPRLRQIERLAGERFRQLGMDEISDDEPPSLDTLATYARVGRSWVAVDGEGTVVGYLLVDVVDGNAHIEQVSVHPSHQGAGVGRALLGQARDWATQTGRPAVTLTTFDHVPWNRRLYEHVGYAVMAEDEIGPELRAVRDAETAHGLDPTTRVCMRLDLTGRGARRD